MHSTFKSNLRTKSSEQLLNMLANKTSWSEEQFLLLLNEVENRGLSTPEIEEYKEEQIFDNSEEEYQSEFDRDMEIISEAEVAETKRDRFQLIALATNLGITFFFAFTIFGGFSLFRVENQLTGAYFYVLVKYLVIVILWFFLIWGVFLGKKYLLSIIFCGGLGLFLVVMSLINY